MTQLNFRPHSFIFTITLIFEFQCVRADHLRRHMRNKHPSVSYCHKSKTIIAIKQDEAAFMTHS